MGGPHSDNCRTSSWDPMDPMVFQACAHVDCAYQNSMLFENLTAVNIAVMQTGILDPVWAVDRRERVPISPALSDAAHRVWASLCFHYFHRVFPAPLEGAVGQVGGLASL